MNRKQWWTFAIIFTIFAVLAHGSASNAQDLSNDYVTMMDKISGYTASLAFEATAFSISLSILRIVLFGLAVIFWVCGYFEKSSDKKKH